MKQLSVALAVIGLFAGTLLVGWFGFGRVFSVLATIGWAGFGLLVAWQLALFWLLGLAWRAVVPEPGLGGLGQWVWGRMVRDSAGQCLPFSQVGGFVMGARAVTLLGAGWPKAAASTVVDVTTEFLAQLIFALFGLAVLIAAEPNSALILPGALGMALALTGAAGFIFAQHGASGLVRRLGERIAGPYFSGVSARIGRLQAVLDAIYTRPGRVAMGALLHLLGWFATGLGSWIAYRLLGVPVTPIAALAIEALLDATLSLAFVVPGGMGVQEAGYAALGAVFGIPPEVSLGVSLLRRGRDLTIGVPVLLVWQAAEMRRLSRRHGAQPS